VKISELASIYHKAKEQGLDMAHLTIPTPKFRGAYPLRVRTPFGLCRWYPSNMGDTIIIYPTLKQIEKLLKKLCATTPTRTGCKAMEGK
jgi:hypothetical protein